MLRKWEDLPAFMQSDEVRPYWERLWERRGQLVLKRIFDFYLGIILFILLSIPMAFIALLIKIEDSGAIFYRQERITAYGRRFKIHKFRTMIISKDNCDTAITVKDDPRVTRVGRRLRRFKLDELPQLIDVIIGDMSFVGTRPEIVKYVDQYMPEYYATLLLPAGITSEASIRYQNEADLLDSVSDVDKVYMEKILPAKMKLNLKCIRRFSLLRDIITMLHTIISVLRKE